MDTVRRRLGLLLISALVVWPGAGVAQPAAQTARIGFLWGGALPQPLVREFEAAMRERGWETKLLRGAKPADLPVEDPSKFELIVNQKAAAALGLTIPPSLMLRADRVIQ